MPRKKGVERVRKNVGGRLGEVEKQVNEARRRAVEEASDQTRATGGDLKGTNTRTGNMKQSWATASQTDPKKQGEDYVTELKNDMEYSSYVNDGHRMDRHFVPGLVLNPYSGMLEYNPDGKGGIIVGTKTAYVPGLHMVDDAKKKYEETAKKELERLVKQIK